MPVPVWLTSIPIAHRGLHHVEKTGIPENSMAAFRAAIDHGYAIELDVRLSKDGVAMVFHDAKLERLTGQPGLTAKLSAGELTLLKILGTNETPQSLQHVVAEVAGRTPIVIEVKNYGNEPVGPLEQATLAAIQAYQGPVAVQSFSPGTVDWFRRHLPNVPRGQIATRPEEMDTLNDEQRRALTAALEADYGAPDFIAYDVRYLPAPLTTRAKAAGRPVLTWTVRSAEAWASAKAHADNPIFEHWLP